VERGRVVVRWIKMEDGRWKMEDGRWKSMRVRVRVYRGWRKWLGRG
jgi:hypothetical protein